MLRAPLKKRLPADAGIALGPILFILAIIGIIGVVLASGGSSGFASASVADRVTADTISQANLIRSKINECILIYGTNTNYETYPQSDMTNGTPVSQLLCPGDPVGPPNMQPLWTGNRPANLPPPTAGFGQWMYINTNATGGTNGGVCIWIQPNASSGGIVQGLTNTAKKFATSTVNDGASEVNYDPSQPHQRFVVWISTPPASGTNLSSLNPNCMPQ